jgi:hypothetical protein
MVKLFVCILKVNGSNFTNYVFMLNNDNLTEYFSI